MAGTVALPPACLPLENRSAAANFLTALEHHNISMVHLYLGAVHLHLVVVHYNILVVHLHLGAIHFYFSLKHFYFCVAQDDLRGTRPHSIPLHLCFCPVRHEV